MAKQENMVQGNKQSKHGIKGAREEKKLYDTENVSRNGIAIHFYRFTFIDREQPHNSAIGITMHKANEAS